MCELVDDRRSHAQQDVERDVSDDERAQAWHAGRREGACAEKCAQRVARARVDAAVSRQRAPGRPRAPSPESPAWRAPRRRMLAPVSREPRMVARWGGVSSSMLTSATPAAAVTIRSRRSVACVVARRSPAPTVRGTSATTSRRVNLFARRGSLIHATTSATCAAENAADARNGTDKAMRAALVAGRGASASTAPDARVPTASATDSPAAARDRPLRMSAFGIDARACGRRTTLAGAPSRERGRRRGRRQPWRARRTTCPRQSRAPRPLT